MPFPQAPAGARRILGGWRWSGWLWCCGRSCWWCSQRMTKRSCPASSGWGGEGQWEKSTKSWHSFWSQAWVSLDLWVSAKSCCHTQGLPSATLLHQGITTHFSTSRYTLVLTFKPTSKMWGGMMWPSLEATPKTITIGRVHELYSGASPISLVEHCVNFRHDRRLLSLLGFVHNWPTCRWSATK